MTAWQESAACRSATGVDPELFFPSVGGDWTVRLAKQVCSECPVVAECLQHALWAPEREGVWGGTTPHEREAIRAVSRRGGVVEACPVGHAMTPRNTSWVEGLPTCRACASIASGGVPRCRSGRHVLAGRNVEVEVSGGRRARRCRACRDERLQARRRTG